MTALRFGRVQRSCLTLVPGRSERRVHIAAPIRQRHLLSHALEFRPHRRGRRTGFGCHRQLRLVDTAEGARHGRHGVHAGDQRFGDAHGIQAFLRIVLPIAVSFCPQLVIVAAGFDAGEGDPLGGYAISPWMYGWMTYMLRSAGNGRLALVLEGGYNRQTLKRSAEAVFRVLLRQPVPTRGG